MNHAIYFVAIIPDPGVLAEVKAFQRYVSEHFGSSRALRAPPHITLIPPFKWHQSEIDKLESELEAITKALQTVKVQLKNFNCFPPRVVYVDVEKNKALENLQSGLQRHLNLKLEIKSDRPDRPFHPHMTVAFRDLRKEMFRQAWEYFSKVSYQREFVVEQICLLQHNGAQWDENAYFKLSTG